MELPKNIVQIGSMGGSCRVYVEDYVVSHLKELNRQACDRSIAVALYGTEKSEDGEKYLFIYGAGQSESLKKEVRHLSQAQKQEIERIRRKYFAEYAFIGYSYLEGNYIEGFYIVDKDSCNYIEGYAQFYEKNDCMLNYLLDVRKEAVPETISLDKYEDIQNRQRERKEAAQVLEKGRREEKEKAVPRVSLQKLQLTAVGVFALLCMFGLATFQDRQISDSTTQTVKTAGRAGETSPEQEISPTEKNTPTTEVIPRTEVPRTTEAAPSIENQLVVEEGLKEAILQENNQGKQEKTETQEKSESLSKEEGSVQVTGAVAYVIQPGDTLTGISLRQYGTDLRVADICNLNRIQNPDSIKEGQVIMLPR